ncbi:hypothetical protein KGQ71_05305 [Patescibacteria group bacterium]|nr:hypothetical protein [Patescibacteria group bacterium]
MADMSMHDRGLTMDDLDYFLDLEYRRQQFETGRVPGRTPSRMNRNRRSQKPLNVTAVIERYLVDSINSMGI